MYKKICFGICFAFSTFGFAQERTASPYSFFGIGESRFNGTLETRNMGGVSTLTDSATVNLQNPAQLGLLRFTTFTIGATNTATNFKNNTAKENARRTSLEYLALGIPLKNAGFAFGIAPYSAVGYKIQNISDGTTQSSQYTGSGGLNKAFLGFGYTYKNWSLGAQYHYLFGDIDNQAVVFDPDASYGSRTKNTYKYSGGYVNFGMMHKMTVKKKYLLQTGITFAPSFKMTSESQRNIATISYGSTGNEIVNDNIDVVVPNTTVTTNNRWTASTSFGQNNHWMIGVEYMQQKAMTYQNLYTAFSNINYETNQQIGVGGFYIPKYNSFTSYFDRVTYRAGMLYNKTGMIVNGQSIINKSAQIGVALPVGGPLSKVNIGLEYGTRGTTQNNLIKENYFNMSVGFSLGDLWFIKSKFD